LCDFDDDDDDADMPVINDLPPVTLLHRCCSHC
jgi:hypothetical protein